MRLEEVKVFDKEANAPLKLLKPALHRASTSDDSDLGILAKEGMQPFERAESQSTITDEEPPESPTSAVVKPAPFKKTDSNNSLFSST
jgi:hypothetical protein